MPVHTPVPIPIPISVQVLLHLVTWDASTRDFPPLAQPRFQASEKLSGHRPSTLIEFGYGFQQYLYYWYLHLNFNNIFICTWIWISTIFVFGLDLNFNNNWIIIRISTKFLFVFEFNRTKHVFLFNDFIPLGYLTNLDIGKVEHGCSKSSTTDAQITLLLCYYRYINEQDSHYNCCQ